MRSFSLPFAVLVGIAAACPVAAQGIPRPAAGTVVLGTCPGESCQLGAWMAIERTPVYDRDATGAGIAFHLERCETVTAVEGFTRIHRLGVFRVIRPYTVYQGQYEGEGPLAVPRGDSLIVMSYVGEGYFHFWWNGMQVLGEVAEGGPVEQLQEADDDWWVLIRKEDGRVGWLNMREARMWTPADDVHGDSDGVPGCPPRPRPGA